MSHFFWSLFLLLLLQTPQVFAGNFSLSLNGSRATFLTAEKIVYFPRANFNIEGLRFEAVHLESGESWPMRATNSLAENSQNIFLNFEDSPNLQDWVRQPTMLVVSDRDGNEFDRTYFQTGNLLDALYRYDGCLGVCWEQGVPTLKVWAPTARAVRVLWVSQGANPQRLSASTMSQDKEGVFILRGESSWAGVNYLYEVDVFSAESGRREKFQVTDPYSVALATNSASSVILNLDDPSAIPEGWAEQIRPPLASRNDAVIYELHVRDFSSQDESVPASLRGTYAAFAQKNTHGDRHLRALADAGITHVHLLPTFDFTSVQEDRSKWIWPNISPGLPPDSPLPQEAVGRVRALDPFNWGYDPMHYLAPEGSYAIQPEGAARVKEFRQMIQALHQKGLRVILDMVFNHTYAAGLAPEAVLDKVVPGYYYRTRFDGQIYNSSCCSDTASERWMMEKLMRDALELWRSKYAIDGFRFDLMNLHSVEVMVRLKEFAQQKDSSLIFYGEAWPFGSLLEKDPSSAYTTDKVYGRGIGAFNDRIRDALRGGTTNSKEKSDPGYLTGLFYDFNHEPANRNTPMDLAQQRDRLLWYSDVVRLGMAGNLRDYSFIDHRGNRIQGGELYFHGSAAGFAAEPEETINYISSHDGYTLWDTLAAKLPFNTQNRSPSSASISERVERQILGLGIIALSQGIPFFEGGSELLRSKSGDQNSYDSGDWFNTIDWTGKENRWGVGLPPSSSNPDDLPFWRPRLSDPSLKPGEKEITQAKEAFFALLRLRKSSPLFRLQTRAEILRRVHFLDADLGPMQVPGIMVMEIRDETAGENLDPNWKRLLVAVNVLNESKMYSNPVLARAALTKLYGKGEIRLDNSSQLLLPARSLTVWGEK